VLKKRIKYITLCVFYVFTLFIFTASESACCASQKIQNNPVTSPVGGDYQPGDTVEIISGNYQGLYGTVIKVNTSNNSIDVRLEDYSEHWFSQSQVQRISLF
jgi:hypothetical protein